MSKSTLEELEWQTYATWDVIKWKYVCPICNIKMISGMFGHLKWHEDLKFNLKPEKSMAQILFPNLVNNISSSDSNCSDIERDGDADTTPEPEELLKLVKTDEERLRVVRFIDKYGC